MTKAPSDFIKMKVWQIFHLAAAAMSITPSTVLIATGPQSPCPLLEAIDCIMSAEEFQNIVLVQVDSPSATLPLPAAAVLDATFSTLGSVALSQRCRDAGIPLYVLSPSDLASSQLGVFPLQEPYAAVVEALKSLKRYYRFPAVNVIGDVGPLSLKFRTSLSDSEKSEYASELVSENHKTSEIIGKIIRPKGNRVSIITTRAEITKEILQAQRIMHVGGVGYANILPITSVMSTEGTEFDAQELNGCLIVAPVGFESAETEKDFYFLLIQRFLASQGSPSPPTPSSEFSVLNIQSGRRVLIGSISHDACTITRTAVFLGNATAVPSNSTVAIPFSGNFCNGDPYSGYYPLDNFFWGVVKAQADVGNRRDLLQGFSLELWNFTAWLAVFSPDFVRMTVLPHREKLGTAIFETVSSTHTIKFANFLLSNNITTPVIGSVVTDPALSSRAAFPYFIRTCISDTYMDIIILQIFQCLGWTRFGILVSNTNMGHTVLSDLEQLAAASGIVIANSPQHRVLDEYDALADAQEHYTAALQDFIDSRARVLVIIGQIMAKNIPVMLYDLGLRRGDVIIVAREWLASNFFYFLDAASVPKAAAILSNSLQFTPDQFVGALGESVVQDYQSHFHFNPPTYTCFYYDSTLTLAYALDWLVHSGQDYMDSDAMMKALRTTRFTGCSGVVKFDEKTNDRSPMRYMIETMEFIDGVSAVKKTGMYDPQGMTLISFSDDFRWADNTKKIPFHTRESTRGCPFEDRLIRDFPQGRTVQAAVSTFLVGLAGVTTFGVWKWGPKREFAKLIEKRELMVEDVVVMLGVAWDMLLGAALSPFLDSIVLPSWSVRTLTSVVNSDYLRLVALSESAVLLWLATKGLSLHLCRRCRLDCTVRSIWTLGCLIEHWLFVPILCVLFRTFSCVQGVDAVGESLVFTRSYLEADCGVYCWQGQHLIHAVLAAVSCIVFIPGVICFRPYFQTACDQINISTNPSFLHIKSLFQVVLCSLSVILQPFSAFAHSLAFLLIWGAFAAVSIRVEAYGYKRTDLWQQACSMMVLWTALISVLGLGVRKNTGAMFLYMGLAGWALIAISMMAYLCMHVPALLYRPKGVNTLYLFKFAFQRTQAAVCRELAAEFDRLGRTSRVVIHVPMPSTQQELVD